MRPTTRSSSLWHTDLRPLQRARTHKHIPAGILVLFLDSTIIECLLSLVSAPTHAYAASRNSNISYEDIASSRVRRQDDSAVSTFVLSVTSVFLAPFPVHIDVTTVLLVDNHGRSSLGRFLSVKPAVGLLTSTARTFIQEGVTTEYATQVLGTTLDNGRLYAHLLTKSSRVLYDNDLPTRSYNDIPNRKWNFDNKVINKNVNFIKNTDYISPQKSDTFLVFPTSKPNVYRFTEKKSYFDKEQQTDDPISTVAAVRSESTEEELLKSASSSNERVPYQEPHFRQKQPQQISTPLLPQTSSYNNVKVFKVNPIERHINLENYSNFKEHSTENDVASNNRNVKEQKYEALQPSKIKPKMDIPTFTVRNDFSPSGFSFLGDLPEFEYDMNTEKSRPTTPAERKAKLLFRGGQPVKQELKDLVTVTHMGFADFTTTVGDTVFVFSPHTATVEQNFAGQVTSIRGDATLEPTHTLGEPTVTSTVKTFMSHDPGMKTETVTGHKFNMQTSLPTMVIDASNRHREPKKDESEEERLENLDAKFAVLAKEQNTDKYESTYSQETSYTQETLEPSVVEEEDQLETIFTPEIISSAEPELTTIFTPEIIQPSETTQTTQMLSTPSEEDIAKIVAAWAAQAASTQATEPLIIATTPSTEVIDDSPTSIIIESESETKVLGGATTIFFEDDFGLFPTQTFETITSSSFEEKPTTNPPVTIIEQDVTTENLPTTQEHDTTQHLTTVTEQTTEKLIPPTEKIPQTTENELTTVNEIFTTSEENVSTLALDETTPELANEVDSPKPVTDNSNQADSNDIEIACTDGGRIVPTTVYKTLTYLTTFFIPIETTTTTSVKSNVVVSTEIGFQTEQCTENIVSIVTTAVQDNTTPLPTTVAQQTTTEQVTTKHDETSPLSTSQGTTESPVTTEQMTTFGETVGTTPLDTTPFEITTEKKHVTEFESEPLETTTDSGEEIELIFKTLYTTYTYLTTFFQESTSSVSSRKEVITNVVTSTLDPARQVSDPAVAGLFAREDSVVYGSEYKSKPASFEDFADITATQTNILQSTAIITPPENDVIIHDNLYESTRATPALSDENVIQTANAIKTYYTTYTYFTTIFVDGETEISSRTEVYTNFITPSGIQASEAVNTVVQTVGFSSDLISELSNGKVESPGVISNVEDVNRELQLKITPINTYNSTIIRQKTITPDDKQTSDDDIDNNIVVTSSTDLEPSYSYSTLHRSKVEATHTLENKIFNINDYETISTMVTDVRSSSSEGERRIIDNVDKRNVLDDQIVAESNNDSEIMPSPTLLLQTSFTTFTYFTTMYFGTTSSNVVSRLETITNVVTETLTPTNTQTVEDQSLPITYFTTFTYWTTLYKDGSTTITSREETVSNVVTPTVTSSEITPTISILQTIEPTATTEITPTTRAIGTASQNVVTGDVKPTVVETAALFPTGLLSTLVSSEVENGITTLFSTDIYGTYIDGLYAKVLESNTRIVSETVTPSAVTPVLPTGILSLNQGKIVDAEGVSTLFYTTQAIGTYIDNLYAQVIESTSSLSVNEERKAALPTDLDPVALAHRTGLVRLIEGSIVQNKTTTLYQSKVLGTIIDGRYAQIIESTSSFIVEKTPAPSATIAGEISPTATQAPNGQIAPTATPIAPSPVVIEGSLNEDNTKLTEENSTEDNDEVDRTKVSNSRVTTRLKNPTKARTSVPLIPFSSRLRPSYHPKRKGSGGNGPTTITRPDFTPTITATPALKSDNTRGRFNGNRRQSSGVAQASATPSGSRRFSRPRATGSAAGGATSTFSPGRGRSSAGKIQPTVSGSRRVGGGGFRTSSGVPGRASSNIFANNSRFRIRPTASSSLFRGQHTLTTPSFDSTDGDNDLTTIVTDDPTDFTDEDSDTTFPISTTTESNLRRSQNPILKFRRPPLARPNIGATTPRSTTAPRKNGNLRKPTTTTPKPKARPTFARPIAAIQNRPRSGNGLFPRRDLFKPRTPPPPEEIKDDEEGDEDILTGDDLDFEDEEDTEYDASEADAQIEKAPVSQNRKSRAYNPIQVKPFINLRRRTKRQTPYSRFRRPGGARATTAAPTPEPTTEAAKLSRTSKQGRFRPRGGTTTAQPVTSAPKRISPSRASSNQGRSQFTLREKDTTSPRSNFKRPKSNSAPQSNSRRTTSKPSTPSRPKAPRLRTTTSKSAEEPSYTRNSNSRPKSNSNGNRRNSGRSRPQTQRTTDLPPKRNYEVQQPQIDSNFVLPTFDGTITITHQIPTEATIPVVNGKMTEYRNIITAKLSTEVLVPQQYTTGINSEGSDVKILTSEATNIAGNGATEITQFILNETPTTSVVFTPTYIRGRRTSYSHVIPSTVYSVEQVVSTIQPQLAAQAPLANILLSQLLLGNLGIPQQNPLLALQNQGNVPAPSPTTEYKTRTTTYVTTVTDATSTVIPLTFRGKEILTTIIDSSTNVITATEFITDTVVVTPTAALANSDQLNSLLLPLLLQQQQQQPASLLQQPGLNLQQPGLGLQQAGLNLPLEQPQLPLQDNVANDLQQNSKELDEDPPAENRSARRKVSRKKPRTQKPTEPTPPKETSVITLYVSGKRPGEFSTVLSTVVVGEENRRKREIQYLPVQPSKVMPITNTNTNDYVDDYIMPAMREIYIESSHISSETESLESIIGDVSKHIESHTPNLPNKGTIYVKDSETMNVGRKTMLSVFSRLQRDTSEVTTSQIVVQKPRRVVKKLVGRRPVSNETLHSDYSYSINSVRKAINTEKGIYPVHSKRRRVIVTKKRRLNLLTTSVSVILPTRSNHRRRVVVTKKRLITKPSTTEHDFTSTVDLNTAVITVKGAYHTPVAPSVSSSSKEILPRNIAEESSNEENESSSSPSFETIFNTDFFIIPSSHDVVPETTISSSELELKPSTTVLTSVVYETKTIETTRLRTYTFIVTRVNGAEQMVTSTTEVKPQVKTLTVTDAHTLTTTLALTDLQTTRTLSSLPMTSIASSEGSLHHHTDTEDNEGRRLNVEEARYNLATRIMSNGVEVIVAGDKSTLPGEPNVRRILSTVNNKPITLAPSTLTDHMMMLMPQGASEVAHLSSSLYQNQFVTKTCLTTYTYLTTYLENGSTTVSSHEQVVSNIATEERNSAKIVATPTASSGITLTQNSNLATGVFQTTYTYLYTIMDDEQPLVITSRHTVANTVTAPDDYLSLLQPSESATAVQDTNTYLSTVALTKTLTDGNKKKVVSTEDVITQVVITESVPPKATSVMTSYIALDVEDIVPTATRDYTTTDVVKTYFVTYTYYNTFLEDGKTVIKTNVSTSSDVVTEKLYLNPKRTQVNSVSNTNSIIVTTPINNSPKPSNSAEIPLEIYATKTYLTTYTYFTTFLQDTKQNNLKSPIVSSNTRTVENVVTEQVAHSALDASFLNILGKSLEQNALKSIVATATLHNGEELEITAVNRNEMKPTKTLNIETTMSITNPFIPESAQNLEPSSPNVITGSTIIFFDEDDQIDNLITPTLSTKPTKINKASIKNELGSLLSSEIVHNDQSVAENSQHYVTSVVGSKTIISTGTTLHPGDQVIVLNGPKNNSTIIPVSDPHKKKVPQKSTNTKPSNNNVQVSDLLNLGSLSINSLTALGPVFNAMAGLIQTNLQSNRRSDNITTTTTIPAQYHKPSTTTKSPLMDSQNRSPIYIPVGGFLEEGLEGAESQNIAAFNLNLPPQLRQTNKWINEEPNYKSQVVIGKPTHESPLVNGGIPISPGQVITANSDVIVGKPAIIGPRIPILNQNKGPQHKDEIPLGMKPPPLPEQTWPKRHNELYNEENNGELPIKPNLQINNFGSLLNVPAIPLQHYNEDQQLLPTHDVNPQLTQIDIGDIVHQKYPKRNYEYSHDLHPPERDNVGNNQWLKKNSQNIQPTKVNKDSPTIIFAKPIKELNLRPPVGDPISLPEVIERSTGQPLLVNIQPSQVANVIIPHGSTTALIFGGASEPHKNGQYFDDPSPYPEPENGPGFMGIENYKNGVPQFASVYNGYAETPHQKPVSGVINVDSHVINHGIDVNVPPLSFGPPKDSIIPGHSPKPSSGIINLDSHIINHDINVHVPPISFGMINHGHDFDAHIINHESHHDTKFSSPSTSYNVIKNEHDLHDNLHHHEYPKPSESHFGQNNRPVSFHVQHHKIPAKIGNGKQDFDYSHFSNGDLNIKVSPQPLPNFNTQEHVVPNGIVLDASLDNKTPAQQSNHVINHSYSRPINRPDLSHSSPDYSRNRPNIPHNNQEIPHNIPNDLSHSSPDYSRNRPNIPHNNQEIPHNIPNVPHNRPDFHHNRPDIHQNTHKPTGYFEKLTPPSASEIHSRPRPRPRPGGFTSNISPLEFMTPPPPLKPPHNIRIENYPKPITIPLNYGIPTKPNILQTNHHNPDISVFKPDEYSAEDLIDDSREDVNEEGEVIQESKTRPLRPGQVPFEVLKINTTTTTRRPYTNKFNNTPQRPQSTVLKKTPPVEYHRPVIPKPITDHPRPFRPNQHDRFNKINNNIYQQTNYPANKTEHPYPHIMKEVNHQQYQKPTTLYIPFGAAIQNQNNGQQSITAKPNVYESVRTTPGYKVTSPHFSTSMPIHEVNRPTFGVNVHHVNTKLEPFRPTSMPVDTKKDFTTTSRPVFSIKYENSHNFGSQTEQPFNRIHTKNVNIGNKATTQQTYSFSNKDIMTTKINPDSKSNTNDFQKNNVIKTTEKSSYVNKENPVYNRHNEDTYSKEKTDLFDITESTNPHNLESLYINDTIKKVDSHIKKMENLVPQQFNLSNIGIVNIPDIDMKPPKLEGIPADVRITPVGNFKETPSVFNLNVEPNTPRPYMQTPSEEMRPPPIIEYNTPSFHNEDVMGLSPPPLLNKAERPLTTHKPLPSRVAEISTYRPIYTTPKTTKKIPPYTFETPTTENMITDTNKIGTTTSQKSITQLPTHVYSRYTTSSPKPYVTTNRPIYRWTKPSSTSGTTTTNTTSRPNYTFDTDKTKSPTISSVKQINSTTIKPITVKQPNIPTMEVIIGHPTLNSEDKKPSTLRPVKETHYKENVNAESDVSVTTKIKSSSSVKTVSTTASSASSKEDTTAHNNLFSKDVIIPSATLPEVYNTGIHHAGNEIKIVDDIITTSLSTPTTKLPKIPTQIKESKVILPTKYITHTQTLTVTTTKTTVVKSLGGPPSTLTLLVTKTRTSTIVDTVTQTHTLVQPTNIIETVTTTINHTPVITTINHTPVITTINHTPVITQDIPQEPPSTYPAFPIQATAILPPDVFPTIINENINDLNEFIITDTEPVSIIEENVSEHGLQPEHDNDSIFVVMTDKKPGIIKVPKDDSDPENMNSEEFEPPRRDEVLSNNEVNRVLLGGILIASPPSLESPDIVPPGVSNECRPDCKASRNELCQRVQGIMRCVCRPGFARMFPDRPCKPTYTYRMKIALSRFGKEKLKFKENLADPTSPQYTRLADATHEGLDRMVMQSDLRDIYHGVQVSGFEPTNDEGLINNFYVQLSDNTDEARLKDVFKKYLRNSNYSLGGTEIYAARESVDDLDAFDFDECTNIKFHDCSEHAQCFNLRGTYTCSCKEGFADLSENPLYPGRICSAELIGCERCHYHGTCYSRGDEQVLCECFQWYAGDSCHINLKVLLIALVTLGTILFTLLLICIILTCVKRRRPENTGIASGMSFLPHRAVVTGRRAGTLDRRAMIQDTSSEGSDTLPYVPKKNKKLKGALKKPAINNDAENNASNLSFVEQRDRSLTVMIPRAKYHPAPPTSPLLNITSFDKRKNSIASSNEAKLLSYLDAGPTPTKENIRRKHSNTPSDLCVNKTGRKMSTGALVSAGFEVSATVGGNNMGTLETIATTCGTEADRSENATLIQKISADLLSSTGTQSQFTTLRKTMINDDDHDPMVNWLDITPRVMTVSEARSYDETTIQPPTKSLRSGYDSKPSSQHHNNDEANTMAERDLGSTFLLPHTHLYKPDRGSDISGFDSL
ncbi:uncharacterized protein CBL_09367 [Carabus blaptoides fortunei]